MQWRSNASRFSIMNVPRSPERTTSPHGDKPIVLIGEDEYLIKRSLEEVVADAGFAILVFANAATVMLEFEKDPAHFCALIGPEDARKSGRLGLHHGAVLHERA
ncbi:FixJ family two-component response regulator [Rhizobium sp. BK529]|nr:FixJ family two-component response regulator [Rhizobium sp. BK529]